MLEKPLGYDRASSAEINERVGSIFPEQQIFRIDHYLGKETVQNLLALRFGNHAVRAAVAPRPHAARADHGRRGGRRRAPRAASTTDRRAARHGAEPPAAAPVHHRDGAAGHRRSGRDARREAEGAARAAAADAAATCCRRRCAASTRPAPSNGKPVVGYLEEKDVPADSTTETFVALKVEIDSWRWAGVPFYLRTGKRLQEKQSEIVITFEDVPHSIYERPDTPHALNRLVIQLQPDESITLTVLAKSPGEGMRLKPVDLSLDFSGRVQDAAARRLRAAADRRHQGHADAVHAPRRAGRGLGVDRSDPRGLAAVRRASEDLHCRQLGPGGRQLPDRPRRVCVEKRAVMPSRWVHEHRFPDRQALAHALVGRDQGGSGRSDRRARRGQPRGLRRTHAGATVRAAAHREARLDSKVWVTLADERWVETTSEDEQRALRARERCWSGRRRRRISSGSKNPAPTPEAGADWATRALTRVPHPFDVVVLGMGEDGHTASLFPGSLALARGLDPAAPPACIAVNALAAPHARVSLNLAALLDSRRIVLHIEGDAKWQVYQRARAPGAAAELPVRAILQQKEVPVDVYWVATESHQSMACTAHPPDRRHRRHQRALRAARRQRVARRTSARVRRLSRPRQRDRALPEASVRRAAPRARSKARSRSPDRSPATSCA